MEPDKPTGPVLDYRAPQDDGPQGPSAIGIFGGVACAILGVLASLMALAFAVRVIAGLLGRYSGPEFLVEAIFAVLCGVGAFTLFRMAKDAFTSRRGRL